MQNYQFVEYLHYGKRMAQALPHRLDEQPLRHLDSILWRSCSEHVIFRMMIIIVVSIRSFLNLKCAQMGI